MFVQIGIKSSIAFFFFFFLFLCANRNLDNLFDYILDEKSENSFIALPHLVIFQLHGLNMIILMYCIIFKIIIQTLNFILHSILIEISKN